MAKEKKTLCEWKKEEIKENLGGLKKLVSEPRFICRKCGRAEKDEDRVCKPEEL